MVARTAPGKGLYEALEALPEGTTGELLNGQLHTQPRPGWSHVLAVSVLNARLGRAYHFDGSGGWWIAVEPEVHFIRDAEVAVADLAGWRRERMPEGPRDQRVEVVPDWVCEVLSPSTRSRDREIKLPLYARYGVAHAWIIDPDARTLEAYELRGGEWTGVAACGAADTVSVAPFEAVAFRLAELWS